ncbi:ATP-binding cassette domain-containing protein [Parabacteroides distasonis]|uniref:ABC transporter ATP-binding protein/permease n=2 Tax=Parabacteroides distasonis TaxID=823 RepID=UPI0030855C28|nr:ATP-binding cassette domain-containing protein [Parabacteroides distasonis]
MKAIEVKQLTKRFGTFTAVDHISFEVEPGEIFGFLGANGAGKTTAMRMLCGLSVPTSGEARVAGFDVYRESESIKRNIGYMSQKFSLYGDLKVWENIRLFGGIYGLSKRQLSQKTDELLDILGLEKERNTLVDSLPLGWKQKLSFSVAIIHDPKIVFLDEPTGGVDPVTRRQFWELIYEAAARGITIFVTTHYMDEAEYCNRVSIMVDGKIEALDSPSALNIVSEKEKGTIEQINVSPVPKSLFLLSKLIPFWVIGFVLLTVAILIAWLIYGLVPEGSFGVIYLFAAVYLIAFTGFGLAISSFSSTQQQAMLTAFFFLIIFALLSGLFTPISSMPEWAQKITLANPVRYFVEVMRMVYLKGSGFADLRGHFVIVCLFAVFFNLLAVISYRKKG